MCPSDSTTVGCALHRCRASVSAVWLPYHSQRAERRKEKMKHITSKQDMEEIGSVGGRDLCKAGERKMSTSYLPTLCRAM